MFCNIEIQSFTEGYSVMENQQPKFGFTTFAETWNGRLAMLGFVLAIVGELLTGQGLLAQWGLL